MAKEKTVRAGRPEDAAALTALCIRSKAHWGYDDAFMAASKPALAMTANDILRWRTIVAIDAEGAPLGVAAGEALPEPGVFDLARLFVAPEVIGTGVGRLLFETMIRQLRKEGASRLQILADPNAEEFYLRMGAKKLSDAPSDAIPGRMLPFLEYSII